MLCVALQVDNNVLMDGQFIDAAGRAVAAENFLITAELTKISDSDPQTFPSSTLYYYGKKRRATCILVICIFRGNEDIMQQLLLLLPSSNGIAYYIWQVLAMHLGACRRCAPAGHTFVSTFVARLAGILMLLKS